MNAIKIFEVNDVDYIAADTKESALEEYSTITDVDDDTEIRELSNEEMDNFKFIEDKYTETVETSKKSFRMKLAEMVAAGEKFPIMFASSEY